ncbi:MAG: Crp/Fnr family transcriptional regulator [Desulfobaccales bacterium]
MPTSWHLREHDFFAGLAAEKKAFMSLAKSRDLKKNDMVFFEGDPGDSCFYLENGLIKIFKITLDGKEPIFFLRRKGEFFGLAEVMEARPRKANAQALTPGKLYEISKKNFDALLASHYPLARRVIEVLGRRLRYLGEQVENLMVCDVSTRLAKLLVYLSYDQLMDEDSWAKPAHIPISLTQEQLASMTGSTQQTVSEMLKKFQEEGLIAVSKRQITILNPLQLLHQAEH